MARKDSPAGDLDETTRLLMGWIGLSMRINRGNEAVRSMADLGLTMPQIAALHALMFEGPRSVTDLGADLGHSMSATSSLVQRLVEQGLVSRTEDPVDRRQKRVELTAAGRKLVERMLKARQKEVRAGLEHLSVDLRAELQRIMRRIVEELGGKADELCGATQAGSRESKESEDES